ncbi:MAG TPA: hypothetical protein VGL23_09100 [Chloroflexota bacterium]
MIVATGLGHLATSTPVQPTATLAATPTELPASPTPSPLATREESAFELLRSPTPELRPSRTVVPTATPVPVELVAPATRGPLPRAPTRTPARSSVSTAGVLQKATSTPAARAPHYDFAHAQTIPSGRDVAGVVLAPGQSNIHRFDVAGSEGQVMVTLSGPDAALYRTTLLSPDGAQAGSGAPVGDLGRAIRAPIRGQTGTWYVEVALDAKSARPRGPYSIRIDVRAAAAAA